MRIFTQLFMAWGRVSLQAIAPSFAFRKHTPTGDSPDTGATDEASLIRATAKFDQKIAESLVESVNWEELQRKFPNMRMENGKKYLTTKAQRHVYPIVDDEGKVWNATLSFSVNLIPQREADAISGLKRNLTKAAKNAGVEVDQEKIDRMAAEFLSDVGDEPDQQ